LLTVSVFGGCSSGDPGAAQLSACEQAVKAASEIDDMHDTVTDLDPAIRDCGTLAEFTAAAAKYPTALDGADAATFVGNRCTYESSLSTTPICMALQ
jgi:hypothetical protein